MFGQAASFVQHGRVRAGIHRFISMSDMKYQAIVDSGITIDERVEIPPERATPADSSLSSSSSSSFLHFIKNHVFLQLE